jgi:hypothetical protein
MLFCLLEFNDEISPSLSSIRPFAEPIEDESPTIEAVFAETTETKPGVAKGNTPNPYIVEFTVATDVTRPDILDVLELILPVFEFIFDCKLTNLDPTSTELTVSVVPTVIEVNVEILYCADRVPVVIVVADIEPLLKSKSPIESGGLNRILSATISRHVISVWSVICACFELISVVCVDVNNCNASILSLLELISVVCVDVNDCNASILSLLELISVV